MIDLGKVDSYRNSRTSLSVFHVPPGATAENHGLEASIAVSKAAMATGDAGTS